MKQIFCPDCDYYQPLHEEPPHADRDGFALKDWFANVAGSSLRRLVLPPLTKHLMCVHDPLSPSVAGRHNKQRSLPAGSHHDIFAQISLRRKAV